MTEMPPAAQQHAFAAVPIDRWSKDHWSLMAYVETLCVDGKDGIGTIDKRKVRCNPEQHPLCGAIYGAGWQPNHGTRLQGYFDFANRSDPAASEAAGFQMTQHDDWDCLDDLNAAGFVETLSMANGFIRLTDEGIVVAAKLREHKVRGGMYAAFQLDSQASERKLHEAPTAA